MLKNLFPMDHHFYNVCSSINYLHSIIKGLLAHFIQVYCLEIIHEQIKYSILMNYNLSFFFIFHLIIKLNLLSLNYLGFILYYIWIRLVRAFYPLIILIRWITFRDFNSLLNVSIKTLNKFIKKIFYTSSQIIKMFYIRLLFI